MDELAFAGRVFSFHFPFRGRDESDGGVPWFSATEGAVGIFGEPRGEAVDVELVGAGEADDVFLGVARFAADATILIARSLVGKSDAPRDHLDLFCGDELFPMVDGGWGG